MGWQQVAMMGAQMMAPKIGEAIGLGPDGAPAMTQPQDQSRQVAQQNLMQSMAQQQMPQQQQQPMQTPMPPDVATFLRQLGLM